MRKGTGICLERHVAIWVVVLGALTTHNLTIANELFFEFIIKASGTTLHPNRHSLTILQRRWSLSFNQVRRVPSRLSATRQWRQCITRSNPISERCYLRWPRCRAGLVLSDLRNAGLYVVAEELGGFLEGEGVDCSPLVSHCTDPHFLIL